MSHGTRLFLYWSPRILGLAFVLLIGIFALDAFQEGHGFWLSLLAFLIHLAPATMVAALLIVAWRWEWVGAVLYLAAAAFYASRMLPRNPSAVLTISGPLLLLAALFLFGWMKRSELRPMR